jgi:uncharacterized membrane protein
VQEKSLDPKLVALTAVMTAVTFVLTTAIQIPTTANGFMHFGDAAIFFASFAFGPWVGAIAGALGTALADVASGFAPWAPFSFIIHGFEGWLVGYLMIRFARGRGITQSEWYPMLLSIGLGSVVVVVGYFIAGMFVSGIAAALGEIPANVIQGLSGGLIGAPLFLAVRRAYPPLVQR